MRPIEAQLPLFGRPPAPRLAVYQARFAAAIPPAAAWDLAASMVGDPAWGLRLTEGNFPDREEWATRATQRCLRFRATTKDEGIPVNLWVTVNGVTVAFPDGLGVKKLLDMVGGVRVGTRLWRCTESSEVEVPTC